MSVSNKKHCCEIMEAYAEKSNHRDTIEYHADTRSYDLLLYEDGEYIGMRHQIYFCPWCGKELPKDLSFEMDDMLEQEYGITEKDWDNEEKIPEEFKTDEWWRKRGL